MIAEPVFDRRVPADWKHIEKYPMRGSRRVELTEAVPIVERVLSIPRQYREAYDQGVEGACVGFSQSWMMSILNRKLYAARRLYQEAQAIDEWPETPPEGGTSLRAGFDVLRAKGHSRFYAGKERAFEVDEGITANRWAQNVDEIRTAIANGIPVNCGVNWHTSFSEPIQRIRQDGETGAVPGYRAHSAGPRTEGERFDYWIGTRASEFWGWIQGGHAITAVAASDRRQAIGWCNTWGITYPFIVWIGYEALRELLAADGEAGIVEDRM